MVLKVIEKLINVLKHIRIEKYNFDKIIFLLEKNPASENAAAIHL